MISDNIIMANLAKVHAITQMKSPQTLKELQCLNGRLAALNRFVSKLAERQLPFFITLKACTSKKNFQWSAKVEEAFSELKKVVSNHTSVTIPNPGEEVFLYLSVGLEAISLILCTERGDAQVPIYFVSLAMKDPETRYSKHEQLLLALLHTTRRLPRYFQAYKVIVVTNTR
jgi:hypothetical protein